MPKASSSHGTYVLAEVAPHRRRSGKARTNASNAPYRAARRRRQQDPTPLIQEVNTGLYRFERSSDASSPPPSSHASVAPSSSPSRVPTPSSELGTVDLDEMDVVDSDPFLFPETPADFDLNDLPPQVSSYKLSRERQSATWLQEVVPSLVPLWFQLLQASQNLSISNRVSLEPCTCDPTVAQLRVLLISLSDAKYQTVCTCRTPQQLLSLGFFPCAPLKPTMAFDVTLLMFTARLFLRSAPGVTSWTAALEDTLAFKGIQVGAKGVLRIRFGNALRWFMHMLDQAKHHITKLIEQKSMMKEPSPDPMSGRPSTYLQRRCALCFSQWKDHDERENIVDVMVQIDACFTQKRTATAHGHDPEMRHPDSLWVSPEVVDETEDRVAGMRTSKPRPIPRPKVAHDIVDECEDNHKASNEDTVKASSVFFSDTGIMALLCRHDNPLFMVNMTSSGEKQHYALALVGELLKNIPSNWTICLLYDIACVLERSCIKWGYLGEDLDRFRFAVSIFHAYGHQYPCQLLYHPRKRPGCGMFDGEGCERYWSQLTPFISILRVSGYHQRLYTLDRRAHFLAEGSYEDIGVWLARKWKACQAAKRESEAGLQALEIMGISSDYLREQWRDEVATEANPTIPHATKKNLVKMMDKFLALWERQTSSKRKISILEKEQHSRPSKRRYGELSEEIKEAKRELGIAEKELTMVKNGLGVSKSASMEKLLRGDWTRLRMTALLQKQKLRYTLRMRKRELERMERAHAVVTNAANSKDQNLNNRINSYVHSKESGVVALWKKFEATITEMEQEIDSGRAPRGAKVPKRILRERLWKLDVDDDIWNDIGLTWRDIGEEGGDEGTPEWLINEEIRSGIRDLLRYDRACEEEEQLKKERRILQENAINKWEAMKVLKGEKGRDYGERFALEIMQKDLLKMIVAWEKKVHYIPSDKDIGTSWGPSTNEVAGAMEEKEKGVIGESIPIGDENDIHREEEVEEISYLLHTLET